MSNLGIPSLQAEIVTGLREAVRDPRIPLTATSSANESQTIRMAANRIVDKVAPLVEHATNTEPWYQSRVTLGAILSGLTPVLALAGWQMTPETRDLVVAAIVGAAPLLGAALTLYGRWRATRPIGS